MFTPPNDVWYAADATGVPLRPSLWPQPTIIAMAAAIMKKLLNEYLML